MSVEPLRVELKSFCQQFSTALKPFSQALDRATDTLREAADGNSLQLLLGDLQDNRHRLKILSDRADQQNTYLVIFGPLKSGKSTLMNAVSGAYVSEVTSLPGYPCLVYVREGESHGFSTTAFNGDRREYASRSELHSSLEEAHEALAKRLREADAANTSFNPAQDFSAAIRRIDFSMPAPFLRESGTILVDTPGLYTKMKYNYGQLTRDFRDTAACAVFVVKTDNLFFEQVFEEFADLLDVFSRVFLVVNIDSSKKDLGSDGSLQPSLEQRDPKRIIEAFENLTMNSQIRSAIDSGRLRIYMIDLLQTATQNLKAGKPVSAKKPAGVQSTEASNSPQASKSPAAPTRSATPASGEKKPVSAVGQAQVGNRDSTPSTPAREDKKPVTGATPEKKSTEAAGNAPVSGSTPEKKPADVAAKKPVSGNAPEKQPAAVVSKAPASEKQPAAVVSKAPVSGVADSGPRVGFDDFLEDLTDYLNSSEYIVEFMGDSLRQANSILHEVKERAGAPEVAKFRAGIETLKKKADTTGQQLKTLDQLSRHEWSEALEQLAGEIRKQVAEHSGSVLPELEKALQSEVKAWAESDESMQDLVEDRVRTKIKDVCQRARARAIEIFDRNCRDRNGGVQVNEDVSRQLKALELSFDDIYADFQPTVRKQLESAAELPDASILQDKLPLRRRFIDWLFFRSEARVRRCVLGSENPSEQAFVAGVKAKRLNEESIQEFSGIIVDYARQCSKVTVQGVLDQLLKKYRETFQADARKHLESRQQELKTEFERIKGELELRNRVLRALDELESSSGQLKTKVGDLQKRFLAGKTLDTPDRAKKALATASSTLSPKANGSADSDKAKKPQSPPNKS